MPKIILHLAERDANDALDGWHLRLYRVIRDMATREGIACEIRIRDRDLTPATREVTDGRFADGNLHIVDDRSVRAAGVLNCAVAYFWEFWHLDAQGTKALSSIGDLVYDPQQMPYKRAEPFFRRQRLALETRLSKYDQKRAPTRLPKGSLAVFLQGDFPRRQGVTAFDDLAMVKTVRSQTDRPVIVKPHPLVPVRPDLRGLDVIETDANVHDILKSCVATVSINSTVALEGFLHRKPAILFGGADFHHFAGRIERASDFPAVLDAELQRKGGYAQYLAWYFLRNCLRLDDPDLEPSIRARFAEAGFPIDRLK